MSGADLELTERRALVTGGTKGIGAAVVACLREAGATVLATARTQPDRHEPDWLRPPISPPPKGARPSPTA